MVADVSWEHTKNSRDSKNERLFPSCKKVTTTNDTRCEKITACDGYKQRTILLKSAVHNASLHMEIGPCKTGVS